MRPVIDIQTAKTNHVVLQTHTTRLTYLLLSLAVSWNAAGCRMHRADTHARPLLEHFPEAWTYYLADANVAMEDVWHMQDDVLICRGTPLGYLYSKEAYGNFSLKLQYRWAPGKAPGKGGVLIRMAGAHKIWPRSLEAQINANDAGDFWGLDGYPLSGDAHRKQTLTHEIYGELTHLKKTQALENAPGQWNTYEIRAEGDSVTLLLNGQQVNQASHCDETPGPICLTSEGTEIHFRTISLTRLNGPL